MQAKEMISDETSSKIKVGTDIIRHLSTTFYPRPQIIFDELISNSRDAMAKNVHLHVNEKTISIEDDGEGMSHDELVHFFYISHSTKPEEPIKTKGGLKREIIGRFGIGKLSLYQICNFFDISTWKDGAMSQASFDFRKFEREEYVDDFTLQVYSEKSSSRKSGTRIVLNGLKKTINARDIKRHLGRTMPLTKDFKVIISGVGLARPVTLASEDVLKGNLDIEYPIDEFVPNVGQVTGAIAYTKYETPESGVYVRVFGRLVNFSNPHGIINFSSLTHAYGFARKIYADLNVNGLSEALLTNRAGFLITHPAYLSFQAWLKKKLNDYNVEVNKKWNAVKKDAEVPVIKERISNLFSVQREKITNKAFPSSETDKHKRSSVEKPKIMPKVHEVDNSMLIHGKKFEIEVEPTGENEPEAVLDKKRNVIIINSLNPLYEISRSHGGVWGVQYHAMRAAIVVFALETSRDLAQFRNTYNRLVKESEEVAANLLRRIPIIK